MINRETGSRETEGHRGTERDTQMLPAKRNQEVSERQKDGDREGQIHRKKKRETEMLG